MAVKRREETDEFGDFTPPPPEPERPPTEQLTTRARLRRHISERMRSFAAQERFAIRFALAVAISGIVLIVAALVYRLL